MKTKLVITTLLSAFIATSMLEAAGSRLHPNPSLKHIRSNTGFTEVKKGDQSVTECKTCDAMVSQDFKTEEVAASSCQQGKQVTCSSCESNLTIKKAHHRGPTSKVRPIRSFRYENHHGDDCLIVARVE